MADEPPKKNKDRSALVFRCSVGGAAVLVVAALVVYPLCLFACLITDDQDTAANEKWTLLGTFGDSFGAINAVFSGVAIIGVVVALVYQKYELGLQLRELKESVENQRRQLHYTAQAQHLKTAKELVLLGLENEELRSWMDKDKWKPQDRYIQLSVNHYFLAWQAHDLKLFTDDECDEYWDSTEAEIKEFLNHTAAKTWWDEHKTPPNYPPKFVKAIDDLILVENAASQCS